MTKSGNGGFITPVKTIDGREFQPVDGPVGWVDEVDLRTEEQYRKAEERRRADQARRAG